MTHEVQVKIEDLPHGEKRISWWEGDKKIEYTAPIFVTHEDIIAALGSAGSVVSIETTGNA